MPFPPFQASRSLLEKGPPATDEAPAGSRPARGESQGAMMLSPLDRRGVLLLAAGAGVGAAGPITAQPDANAELAALLDAYARSTFDRHPELVTALGLDRGSLAPAR